eukprot:6211183-Pleurochrysis_carterae.AAC.3
MEEYTHVYSHMPRRLACARRRGASPLARYARRMATPTATPVASTLAHSPPGSARIVWPGGREPRVRVAVGSRRVATTPLPEREGTQQCLARSSGKLSPASGRSLQTPAHIPDLSEMDSRTS